MDIPTFSSEQISQEIKRLVESSAQPEVVCFDYFDTLVTRTVLPENTKRIASCQLAAILDNGIDGETLYGIRRFLEKRLCKNNQRDGHDLEFDLIGLGTLFYRTLLEMCGGLPRYSQQEFVECYIDIELAVEKNVQQLNAEVVDILTFCHKSDVTTAIISDFYLPKAYFSKLLEFHKLSPSIDYVFISADFLKTKGNSGKLYNIAINTICTNPDKMWMIGDNPYADGVMARNNNLNPLLLAQTETRQVGRLPIHNDRVCKADTDYDLIFSKNRTDLFPEIGLSLHWFIHQLFVKSIEDKCETLFFCSKEGELLKTLFERYQTIRFGRQIVDSHYLIVSRKATFICSLGKLEEEHFERLFSLYKDISLLEFLKSLNFSDSIARTICQTLDVDPQIRHQCLQDHQDYKTVVGSDYFKHLYEKHRNTQKKNFISYLESFGFDCYSKGLTLVDVGWKGSIQNNIYLALDGAVKVTGYYIGLLSPTGLRKNNSKKGLLFSDYPEHSQYIHVFNNNRSLFEIVLGASHGSADGYFSEDQFGEQERDRGSIFLSKPLSNTATNVTIFDLPEERELFETCIAPMQKAIIKLCNKLTKSYVLCSEMPPFRWIADKHARMVFKPTSNEVELFSRLYHLENFGIFEFTNFKKDNSLSLLNKINNLIALKKDPAAFLETGVWPPIIFRRLGLGFLSGIDGERRYKRIFKEGR